MQLCTQKGTHKLYPYVPFFGVEVVYQPFEAFLSSYMVTELCTSQVCHNRATVILENLILTQF